MTSKRPLRTILTLTFINKSQLRVGAGDEGDVFNDYLGNPYIPSTTIKGAARAVLVRAGFLDQADVLFGTIGEIVESQNTGRIGGLVFSGAVADAGALDPKGSEIRLECRSAIDDESGVADHNKLFKQRSVRAGTTWTSRLTIDGKLDSNASGLVKKLIARLRSEGFQVGRNKGDGDGVLVLTGVTIGHIVEIEGQKVDLRRLTTTELATWWPQAIGDCIPENGEVWILKLSCDGPFALLSGGDDKVNTAKGERGNVLKSIRDKDDNAVLPGSSFMGALRSKAEWVEALMHLRRDTQNEQVSTTRLFGSQDSENPWAGVLVVDAIQSVSNSKMQTLTSVKIDRFTQAAIEGGLFAVEAFIDPIFTVRLRLSERSNDDDKTFFNELLNCLAAKGPNNGLTLGHGANHGFGWFSITNETRAT